MKNWQKACQAKKPKVLYECFDYFIEQIPLNYRATIKCAIKPKEKWRKIDRELYTHPEHGLEHIKELANKAISEWFLSGVPDDLNEKIMR